MEEIGRFSEESSIANKYQPIDIFSNYNHKVISTKEAVTIAMGVEWTNITHSIVESLIREPLCISHQQKYNITTDEARAISYYTLEVPQKGSLYSELNTTLSQRRIEEKWKPYMWILLSGLSKLPNEKVKVYRAVKVKLGQSPLYKSENVIIYITFTSTSMKKSQLQVFSGNNNNVGSTWLLIHAIEGKDISPFSKFKAEQEILLMPNTYLQVQVLSDDFKDLLSLNTSSIDYIVLEQKPTPPENYPINPKINTNLMKKSDISPFQVCYEGNLDKLKEWHEVSNGPLEILNQDRPDHPSLLYTAASRGHIDIVTWLISNGLSVHHGQGKYPKSSPLHGAAFNGHHQICKFLIQERADIYFENEMNESAIDNANEVDLKQNLLQWSKDAPKPPKDDTPIGVVDQSPKFDEKVLKSSSRLLPTNEEKSIHPREALSILNTNFDKNWLDTIFKEASARFSTLKPKMSELEFIALYTFLSNPPTSGGLSLMAQFEEDIQKGKRHKWRFYLHHVIHALRKIPPVKIVGYCVGSVRSRVGVLFLVSTFMRMNTKEILSKDPQKKYVYKCECFSARQLSFINPCFPEDEILCHPNSLFQFTLSGKISDLKQIPAEKDTLKLEK